MNQDWKKDPRVKKLDPKKLQMLTELATKLESTPKNQWANQIVALNMEANQKGLTFSDEETSLIFSILSADMSPAELQRMNTLKMLSQRFNTKKKR